MVKMYVLFYKCISYTLIERVLRGGNKISSFDPERHCAQMWEDIVSPAPRGTPQEITAFSKGPICRKMFSNLCHPPPPSFGNKKESAFARAYPSENLISCFTFELFSRAIVSLTMHYLDNGSPSLRIEHKIVQDTFIFIPFYGRKINYKS